MSINLLLIEDHLSLIAGLRGDLETGHAQEAERIEILDRVLTTIEDGVAFFEAVARHGADALRKLPVNAVMVDGFLPRDSHASYAEFGAIEIAIRITALYDRAGIADDQRPCLILTTAAPDPCDVRAFVAYGGTDVLKKAAIPAEELRARLLSIVRGEHRWSPPEPKPLHGYSPSFGRYLRGIELGAGTAEVASRINAAQSAVTRVKNELRHVLDLAPRASDREIIEAAKRAGITWIPLAREAIARSYGVRPRLTPW